MNIYQFFYITSSLLCFKVQKACNSIIIALNHFMDSQPADQRINLDELKRQIDAKLDNIYRLLGVERPRFCFHHQMYQRYEQIIDQTKKTQQINTDTGFDLHLESLTSKESLNNSQIENSAIKKRQALKIKRKTPFLTQRMRTSTNSSRLHINLDNKNKQYDKILKMRKAEEEISEKQRIAKNRLERPKIMTPKTYEQMRDYVLKNYMGSKKQRNEVNGPDKVRSKLLEKIANIKLVRK